MKKKLAKTVYWGVLLLWLAAAAKLGWMILQDLATPDELPAIEQPVP